jgi:PAS domain S-box-containing protein
MTDINEPTHASVVEPPPPCTGDILHFCRVIAEHTSDMIWIVDFATQDPPVDLTEGDPSQLADHLMERLTFTYASPASERIFGYTPEQMRNRTLKSMLTESSYHVARGEFIEELTAIRSSSEPNGHDRTIELEHVCQDGSRRWCEVRGKAVRGAAGELTALLGITRDISDRKRAADELSRFHAIVSESPAVVFAYRAAAGWPVEFVSNNVQRYGRAAEEFTSGRINWSDIVHPEDRPRIDDEITQHLQAGRREFHLEYRIVTATGEIRWIEDRNLVVRDQQGAAQRVEGIAIDVTERWRAVEATQESAATLLQLFTHLPDFVLVIDREARIKFVNRGTPGVTADKLIGSIGFAHIRPEYVPACQQALEAAFDSGRVQQVEVRTIYDKWWDCRIIPLVEDEPSTTAMIICNDITQHRSAERWTRIQHALNVRLSETSDLQEALEASLDAALEITEFECGGVYLVDEPAGVKLYAHRGVSASFDKAVDYFEHETDAARIMREGKPVYARPETFPAESVDRCEREGLISSAFVPICHEGRTIGCLIVGSRDVDEVPETVRRSLEATVSYVGAAVARIQADESRLKSEARFRTLVENMPDTVMFTDLESRILYINHTHSEAPVDSVVGTTGLQYSSPDQHEVIRKAHRSAIETRQVQPFDCTDRWGRRWLCRAVPRFENGEVRGLMVITTEVTDKWRAEEELRKSEERFRLIAENLSDVVWTLQIEGLHEFLTGTVADPDLNDLGDLFERAQFTFFSPSVEQVLGYTVDEALRLNPLTLIAPSSHLLLLNGLLDTIALIQEDANHIGGREAVELEHVKRDGQPLWCELTAKILRDVQGNVIGLEGVTRDISERKSFEKELSAVITHEQQRMGQELHDELGQQLVGARLIAEGLQKALHADQSPATQQARELHAALEKAQHSVRELIKGVRPVEIDADGLMAALDDLASSTRRLSGIQCSFAHSERVPVEDNHTATQLYYIAREAVRNAVEHAAPRKITIGLAVTHGVLRLWVSDDGSGIPGRAGGGTGGMGLRIMRYRAGVVGAQLMIEPGKDGGTRITCSLPMEQVP